MILGSQGTAKNFRVVSFNGVSYEALPHSQLSINFPKTECSATTPLSLLLTGNCQIFFMRMLNNYNDKCISDFSVAPCNND